MKVYALVCVCVRETPLYNHVCVSACVDVGGASMSVLERQNALDCIWACVCVCV